jgi:hypothetical protein
MLEKVADFLGGGHGGANLPWARRKDDPVLLEELKMEYLNFLDAASGEKLKDLLA